MRRWTPEIIRSSFGSTNSQAELHHGWLIRQAEVFPDADRRTSVTYPNTNSVTYAYNVASELTTVTYKKGTTTLGTLTYTYDAAGNRIKTGGTFARSNIPPALSTTTYNANNQQTTFGTTTETYDLNGNLATNTDAGVTTTYTLNARNQLTGISRTGLTASFTYDSFGRRTGKTINGTTTNFVYDGLNPVQEKNGATVTANLLIGLGIDEFLTRTDALGTRALLTDALGSTIALGDGTGTLQTQYTYEPFGFVSQTGAASTNSFKYTGREDDGSGLAYYRARYYHPRLQRFIAEDPIGFRAGDVNLYAYVGNKPISRADPSGLESATVTLGIDPFANPGPYPYDPRYLPTPANCAIYGSTIFGSICRNTPNNPPTNCSRQCLAWSWPGQWNAPWYDLSYAYYLIPQHPICWVQCQASPSDFCPGNNQ